MCVWRARCAPCVSPTAPCVSPTAEDPQCFCATGCLQKCAKFDPDDRLLWAVFGLLSESSQSARCCRAHTRVLEVSKKSVPHSLFEEAVKVWCALGSTLCPADISAACQAKCITLVLILLCDVHIAQGDQATAAISLDHLHSHHRMPAQLIAA